jgi:hypothetical protein
VQGFRKTGEASGDREQFAACSNISSFFLGELIVALQTYLDVYLPFAAYIRF